MHIIYIFPVIIQNKGYAPGLALSRRGVSSVSQGWLWNLLLYEDLLLVLFNHLLVLLLARGHKLHHLVLYMHEMIIMQQLIFRQQQLLKYEHTYYAIRLALLITYQLTIIFIKQDIIASTTIALQLNS